MIVRIVNVLTRILVYFTGIRQFRPFITDTSSIHARMEGLFGLYQDSLGDVAQKPDRLTRLYFEIRESNCGRFDQLENFVIRCLDILMHSSVWDPPRSPGPD